MAVTLTVQELAASLRLGGSPEELAEATRLLAYTSESVERHAPHAPDVAQNEAAIRLAGFLYDQPFAGRGLSFAHALRSSGAASILLPYRIHRASSSDAVAAAQSVGTAGNPVVGVDVVGSDLVVTFADGGTTTQALPAGVVVGSGTGDLLVERLGTLDNPTLPAGRVWVGTGIEIPDSVHVLMVDAGQVSDDYHLVDWDAVRMHPFAVAGTASSVVEFETFAGDAFTVLRIGHDGNEQILIANEGTDAINLLHIHVERLLAPIGAGGSGTTDTVARASADEAQTRADSAFTAAGLAHNQANNAVSAAATNAAALAGLPTIGPDPLPWAEEGNTDTIPPNKIASAIRGHRVFVQTSQPSGATSGDIWIQDLTTAHPRLYEYTTSWVLDYSFFGGRVHTVTSAHNIAQASPESNTGDVVLELVAGTLKLYKRLNRNSNPFWSYLGAAAGGGGAVTVGALTPFIEPYAFIGNDGTIPANRLPFTVEPWARGESDIPYSAIDNILESWAVKDTSPPLEIIPDIRLPVARFLPSPTALADGLVATISSGAWAAVESASGASVTSKQWRFDFVRGEDTADPIAAAGQVFIELRYLDSYNSMGVRTNVQDVGAGFLASDGSRVLSSAAALDVKGLLAQSSLSAVMELVTSLPTPGTAVWGQWYGQSDSAGRVTDVYYRREESRTEQLWLPARLNAQNRNLHGFSTLNSTLTYGYERGGALSPEAGIIELVEELDAGGNYTTRVLVPNDGPLNSAISVILFWKSDGQSGYTTSREIPLFHDASFFSGETNRYVSAVYTDAFKFDPGRAYTIKWRNAGGVNDLVIQPSEALRRVVDEEELAESVAKINRELYETEDRVAALESAGGGRALLYNQNFNYTGTNTFQQLAAPGAIAPTSGLGAIAFAGTPINTLEVLTFDWASLAVLTEGASSAGLPGFHYLGGGNYSFTLARTVVNHVMMAAPNSAVDASPMKIWDLG